MSYSGGSGGHAPPARRVHRLGIAVALIIGLLAIQAVRSVPAGAIPQRRGPKRRPSTVPPALQDPSMAFDTATSQLIMVGAVSGDEAEETWLWDGTNWDQLCRGQTHRRDTGPHWLTTPRPANCSCSAASR